MMKFVSALCMTVSLLAVSGCTVLGLALDMQTDGQAGENTTAGVEADIAIAKHIADKLKPEPQPSRLRCSMDNGVRICFEAGTPREHTANTKPTQDNN